MEIISDINVNISKNILFDRKQPINENLMSNRAIDETTFMSDCAESVGKDKEQKKMKDYYRRLKTDIRQRSVYNARPIVIRK